MELILWILVGILVGGTSGVLSMALISFNRISSMENEIQDLRVQRKLLKDEVLKLSTKRKPNPRRSKYVKARG
jgi:hypothetical protein|tara:strand:+ start:1453 stop:1671 length:219 start_codon:yes stop_codon:yes gene_type:complete